MSIRRHPVSAALAALVIAFLWLPLVAVVINSFNRLAIAFRVPAGTYQPQAVHA